MTKFNIGDEVRIKSNQGSDFNIGDVGVIKTNDNSGYRSYEVEVNGEREWFDSTELELVEKKITKNQRITALESEVAELKLIVHELRDGRKTMRDVMNEVLSEPSTTTVEDIIEFEGQQYRKVDRQAREGDVVMFTVSNVHYRSKKSYKVIENVKFADEKGQVIHVYNEHKRTPENVDVYELIKEGLNPQIPIVEETIEPLTPNQQRAAIIEKAKKFVEDNLKLLVSYDFIVNNNVLKLYSRQRYQDIQLTTAKCSPNDVFNEYIGKAIALGRALGLDVSEFEQAVQPNEVVMGMNLEVRTNSEVDFNHEPVDTDDLIQCNHDFHKEDSGVFIINDTNAKYEVSQ